MEKSASTPAKREMSIRAAHLSIASGAAAIAFLAALHALSPEFDPALRMVSEYALGEYGWVLRLMFLFWALSGVTLFFAIKSQVHTVGGKIGLGLLLLSSIGAGLGAIFDIRHSLHGLAFLLGIPSLPIAALLISFSLARNPAWVSNRRSLVWLAHLTWLSIALMMAVMLVGMLTSSGQSSPEVPIGWPNRLVVLAYCGWMIAAARGAMRISP